MLRTTSFLTRLSGMVSLLFVLPLTVALAAAPDTAGVDTLGTFLLTIIYFIDRYVVPFIFALAFIIFLWGIYSTFIAGGANEEKRQEGQKILIYGMVGFFIMISIWGLVNLLVGTFGFNRATRPELPFFGAPTSGAKSANPFINTTGGASGGGGTSGGGNNANPSGPGDCDAGYTYVATYGIDSTPACVKTSNSSSGGNNANPSQASDCDPGYTYVATYGIDSTPACVKN